MLRLICLHINRRSGLRPIPLALSTILARGRSSHHITPLWDLGRPYRLCLLDNNPHTWFPFPMARQNNRHCQALSHMKLVEQYISTIPRKCLLIPHTQCLLHLGLVQLWIWARLQFHSIIIRTLKPASITLRSRTRDVHTHCAELFSSFLSFVPSFTVFSIHILLKSTQNIILLFVRIIPCSVLFGLFTFSFFSLLFFLSLSLLCGDAKCLPLKSMITVHFLSSLEGCVFCWGFLSFSIFRIRSYRSCSSHPFCLNRG